MSAIGSKANRAKKLLWLYPKDDVRDILIVNGMSPDLVEEIFSEISSKAVLAISLMREGLSPQVVREVFEENGERVTEKVEQVLQEAEEIPSS